MSIARKRFLTSAAGFASVAAFAPAALAAPRIYTPAQIEAMSGGRLGVTAVDLETGSVISHNASQRFAMCSTFKLLLVADVLARVDRKREHLSRHVHYGKPDLLEYAPVTREHVSQGVLTVEALCAAAIEYSDNTAANLLMKSVGGPDALTRFMRASGDGVTNMNRYEPALNTAYKGDTRDTTSPRAMAADVQHFVLGPGLSKTSQALLTKWLLASKTGLTTLRAGLPSLWKVGDKTGTGGGINRFGDSDTRNDVAIVWPPGRAPIVIAIFLTGSQMPAARRDAALADVGRYIAHAFARA